MKIDLSVIILSFNTKELTKQCLSSLIQSLERNKKLKSEIIVIDNGSTDGSLKNIKYQISNIILRQAQDDTEQSRSVKDTNKKSNILFKLISNKKNLGYPKGNNQGLKVARGKYILLLNSDVIVEDVNFEELIYYLEANPKVGALTVKVFLSNGNVDQASHRGFPTIWNSFCYFTGLESIFNPIPFLNKIFGGYHLTDLDKKIIHEIDSPSGAFYLVRANLIRKLGGFDEDFFMYGEDLDLSYRIKELGYKIIYYPKFSITHLKHASGLEKSDFQTRNSTKHHFFNAMKIFYKKHYQKYYPAFVNSLVNYGIEFLKRHVQNRY